MANFSRKRRRAMKRMVANNMSIEQTDKMIVDFEGTVQKRAREAQLDWKSGVDPRLIDEMRNQLTADFMTVLVGYLRVCLYFDKSKMKDFLTDFILFSDSMQKDKVSLSDIEEVLKSEIDFDFAKEYADCAEKATAEEGNYNSIRSKQRQQSLLQASIRRLEERRRLGLLR